MNNNNAETLAIPTEAEVAEVELEYTSVHFIKTPAPGNNYYLRLDSSCPGMIPIREWEGDAIPKQIHGIIRGLIEVGGDTYGSNSHGRQVAEDTFLLTRGLGKVLERDLVNAKRTTI